MAANEVTVNVNTAAPGAVNIPVAKVTDVDGANYQAVVIARVEDSGTTDGAGNPIWNNIGYFGEDHYFPTVDSGANAKLNTLIDSTDRSNYDNYHTNLSAKGRVELSDDTETELIPAISPYAVDIIGATVASIDTVSAVVDFIQNSVVLYTVSVPAGDSHTIPSPIIGSTSGSGLAWNVKLRANPATGTVCISASGRQIQV